MVSDHERPEGEPLSSASSAVDRPGVLEAHKLFRGEREICTDHGGVRYRLRITRRNKLILQK